MTGVTDRLPAVWRRAASLGWPVAVEQTLTTMMRTVDVIVTGLFSPAAVAAVGLADLYSQVLVRVGLGLGSGAIALSSQDTGRGAGLSRDRAITQALILGVLSGIPLAAAGVLFSTALIAVLGAEAEVVRLGGSYLAIVFAVAPMRIFAMVASRSLQGTGDTMTPMYVNGASNALNIVLTVALGLGLGPAPRLGIVGVGLATAISRVIEAGAFLALIGSDRTVASFAWPRDVTVTRQLVAVSAPNFAEGMSASIANFPLNALILLFGTEANAGYHIARRVQQQFIGPLYRSLSTVASIVVGQALGAGRPAEARDSAAAIVGLSLLVHVVGAALLFVGAGPIVGVFTGDPTTAGHAADFTRVYALSMVFFGVFFPLAGALRGAGDTRTPFYARLVGTFVFMLGVSYLLAIRLGWGLPGVYVGIVLCYVSWVLIAVAGFRWGGWQDLAATMIGERESGGQ